MKPTISIIVPTLNVREEITDLIASIDGHAARHLIELIVIDGGSTDGTAEALATHRSSIDQLNLGRDSSIYEAMNKGIDVANGEWFLFMGADDRLLPSAMTAILLCEDDGILDCVVGNVIYETGHHVRSKVGWINLFTNRLHHQGAFYHRRCFTAFRYDPSYPICADYELNLALVVGRKMIRKVETDICWCGANGFSVTSHPLGRQDLRAIRVKYIAQPWRGVLETGVRMACLVRDWKKSRNRPILRAIDMAPEHRQHPSSSP